jgi:hypothetical protein
VFKIKIIKEGNILGRFYPKRERFSKMEKEKIKKGINVTIENPSWC